MMPHNEMPASMRDPSYVKPQPSPAPPPPKGPFGQCGVAPSGTIERPKGQEPVPGGLIGSAGVEPSGTVFKDYDPVQTKIAMSVRDAEELHRCRAKCDLLREELELQKRRPTESVPRRFLIQWVDATNGPPNPMAPVIKMQLDDWARDGGAMVIWPGWLIFGEHNGAWQCLNGVAEPPAMSPEEAAVMRAEYDKLLCSDYKGKCKILTGPQLPWWRRLLGVSR